MTWFFLVGFMGSGKTTLGAEVAARLELPFFDLDREIERDAGVSIAEIFDEEGEDSFRERETVALRRTLRARAEGLLATGGGAFTIEANRNMMTEAGITVWLDVPVDEIAERVMGHGRPKWEDRTQAHALAEERQAYYRLANVHLEMHGLSVEESSAHLYRLLEPYRRDS